MLLSLLQAVWEHQGQRILRFPKEQPSRYHPHDRSRQALLRTSIEKLVVDVGTGRNRDVLV